MDKKGSAKCDPGWNDPPLFSYESQTAQLKVSKPRTFLNKRVAYPLNDASPPNSSNLLPVDPTAPLPACNITTLPPPPSAPIIPCKVIPVEVKNNADSDVVFNSSQALETVIDNLYDVLHTKFENEEKDKSEIQRRLDIMKKLWVDNKLCEDVEQKLFQLSEALKKDEIEKADDLQKGLMVDHGPACSLWMSAIRHLIHHKEPEPTNQHVED